MAELQAQTKLDAVNSMLGAIGADPVNSLSNAEDSDVITAQAVLHETSREVQSQGWDFNTDDGYALAKTVDNEYVLPTNVIDIDVSDDHASERVVWRSDKLWDKNNHTFVWTKDLTFDITWFLDFDEMPQTARHYIAMKAARKFQARTLGSSSVERYTQQDEDIAFSIFRDAESLSADHNILNGSYAVARVLRRTA